MTISPYLVGQNAWWQEVQQYQYWPQATWTTIKNAGVTIVRIGGHHFDKHIPEWSSDSYNIFLGWIDQIFAIGAVPIVQASRWMKDSSGALVMGDPQTIATNAAALVALVNSPQRTNHVKYWTIGNEPNLDPYYAGGSSNPQSIANNVAAYITAAAPAMRNVDSTIQIYGPDLAWYEPDIYGPLLGGNADITGQDNQGRYYIDGVTFHRYPFGSSGSRSAVLTEMQSGFPSVVQQLLSAIGAANTLHSRTGTNALSWALTEFNVTYSNPSPNAYDGWAVCSFLNGQFFATYIGQGMQNNASFMTAWSVNEGGGAGGAGDLGFLSGDAVGNSSGLVPRSSYYHMQMIANLQQGSFVTSISNQVNVPAISSMSSTQVGVMILNEDTNSHSYTVRLNGDTINNPDTNINVQAGIAQQCDGSITGQTSVVLLFDPLGNLTKRITYSLANCSNNQPPQVG